MGCCRVEDERGGETEAGFVREDGTRGVLQEVRAFGVDDHDGRFWVPAEWRGRSVGDISVEFCGTDRPPIPTPTLMITFGSTARNA